MLQFLRSRKRRQGKELSWLTMVLVGGMALALLFGGVILLWFATLEIPSLDSFHTRRVAESTKIYDRTGDVLLYDVHGTIRRTVVPLEEVSRHVKNAAIAIEDPEFYQHAGVKPTAIIRAVLTNLREGDLLGGQGGSTITQQVVKNTLLTPEKTVTRKVKEWILSLKLEKVLEKDQILEIYLNETPYGGVLYGIEEASKYFFGKSANEVTLAEAAYLAALPQAPTYYSPYGNHREDLDRRKDLVLAKMLEHGFITQEEHDTAMVEEVVFIDQGSDSGIKAPHFVFYVLEYLEAEYGVNAVNESGLTVITSLDWELQEQAQEIVTEYALSNEARFNAENAAMVAVDPNTGEILVMVGSRGYSDPDIEGKFNAALGRRQPGSSFKPFIYATAFTKGYTPETVLYDVRTQFSTVCDPLDTTNSTSPCYSPQNYDHAFRGPMTIRDALAQSVNIPAVKALYLTGLRDSLETAERMGISTLTDPNRYGLTLVLGGGEVTLLDMVSAYGVFATEGVRHPHTAILRVEDADRNVLEEYETSETRVLEEQAARQISDILSDNVARTPLYGANSPLNFPGYDVAAKTGTTNNYIDAWVVGYTPNLVVGTWAGNNTPEPMTQISGLIVTPMWNEFMQVALADRPVERFTPPEPTPNTVPPLLRGIWNQVGPDGFLHSILYWITKENPRSGSPTNPQQDAQFNHWEYPVKLWGALEGVHGSSTPPIIGGGVPGTGSVFTIIGVGAGTTVPTNQLLTIGVNTPSGAVIQRVSYYLNDAFVGSSENAPFAISVMPDQSGPTTIRAVAEGNFGTMEQSISFQVQ